MDLSFITSEVTAMRASLFRLEDVSIFNVKSINNDRRVNLIRELCMKQLKYV